MTVASEESLSPDEAVQKAAEVQVDGGELLGSGGKYASPLRLPTWLRLAIGGALLAYLIWRSDVSRLAMTLARVDTTWLMVAVGVQLIGKAIWSLRWKAVLRALRHEVSFWRLFRGIFIGQFFNNFLPTSVGGDFYRGYWILDDAGEYRRSMFIVFLERFIGLITLGYVALTALVILLIQTGQSFEGDILVIGLGLLALCGSGILLRPSVFRRADELVGSISGDWFRDVRAMVGQGLEVLQRSGGSRWGIYALSVAVQFVGIGFYFALGRAIMVELDFWHYVVIVPLVSVATMLPITMNGLGVREGSLVLLIHAIGADVALDRALALGLVASFMVPLISLIGGWFYIRGRGQENEDVRLSSTG